MSEIAVLGFGPDHAEAQAQEVAMNHLRLSMSGDELSRLRTKVEAVGKEIGLVTRPAAPGEGPTPKSALDTTWADLVQMLDLGSEPAMRTCPHCRALCMAGASRCGNCWASLPAPDAGGSADGRAAKQGAAASG
jgi:hypothetical protein